MEKRRKMKELKRQELGDENEMVPARVFMDLYEEKSRLEIEIGKCEALVKQETVSRRNLEQ